MDPISDWVRRNNPNWFTTNDALIGSQLRELETLKKADQKPVCEVLKKLGFKEENLNGVVQYVLKPSPHAWPALLHSLQ